MSDSKHTDHAAPPTAGSNPAAKLWGGRFEAATDPLVEAFSASVQFDSRLFEHDIAGSIAHATMLCKVGVLDTDERDRIVQGLSDIRADIRAGRFEWKQALEDVHMNIEARLVDLIGDAGNRLHTGRSRNDQVATDIRLYLRGA
ncbi:MAG: argininosuccinate lyase, partial [Gammaproteobacteria bacterium]|nr:argininosuccinate lyase [Gammaproteobacteria bacterium]